jgi:hypothetical protein
MNTKFALRTSISKFVFYRALLRCATLAISGCDELSDRAIELLFRGTNISLRKCYWINRNRALSRAGAYQSRRHKHQFDVEADARKSHADGGGVVGGASTFTKLLVFTNLAALYKIIVISILLQNIL